MTKHGSLGILFLLFLALAFGAHGNENDGAGNPPFSLGKITGRWDDKAISGESLENEMLPLIKFCKSNDERAMVYYKLSEMYGSREGRIDWNKSLLYSTKVVELNPSDISMLARSYTSMGGAIVSIDTRANGESFASARRRATVPYLKGIKVMLDNKIPSRPEPLPEAPSFISGFAGPDKERYEQELKDHDRKLKAYNEASKRNDLVSIKKHAFEELIYAYSRPPYATDELSSVAMEVLGDREAVNEIVSRVKDAVAKNVEKGKEK